MNNVHGIVYAYHSFPELRELGALRTGASLPFFSSGGTALALLLAEVGVVLAVSRQTKDTEDQ